MNTRQRFVIAAAFVALSAVVSLLAAPELPDQLVTNWGPGGEPNGTMGQTAALALVPGLGAVLLGLFALVPRIDPLRENIASFRRYYDWFVVVFAAYLAVLHTGIVAFNLGYAFDMTLFVLAGVAGLFYYLSILLENAERNWFVGIRTPWTMSSDEVWRRTHALGARLFKLTAVLAVVGLAFGEYAVLFLVVPALSTAVVTVVYSYYLYEQLDGGDPASDV
ncbi:SdpI family protein [Haloarchaeobius baliensis]|uniref:SdpI family protein n=1 Tax=Haloarchaeobius baliensis TaxID=1670458 RepID=UPI003F884795